MAKMAMKKMGKMGMMPKTKKTGKKMNFSQSVLGTSSTRSMKPSVGMIVSESAGTVTKDPPKKLGKRVF